MFTTTETPLRIADNPEIRLSSELTDEDCRTLPVTEFIMRSTFWVGVAQNLTDTDMEKISSVLYEFVTLKTQS